MKKLVILMAIVAISFNFFSAASAQGFQSTTIFSDDVVSPSRRVSTVVGMILITHYDTDKSTLASIVMSKDEVSLIIKKEKSVLDVGITLRINDLKTKEKKQKQKLFAFYKLGNGIVGQDGTGTKTLSTEETIPLFRKYFPKSCEVSFEGRHYSFSVTEEPFNFEWTVK
jgi:hypothetical protein